MSSVAGLSTTWAVVVILVIPAVIVAAAELDERLRQRESPLRGAVQVIRTWLLPFFAIWALLVPVLGADSDSTGVRIVASGMVLSVAAASVSVLRVGVGDVRRRTQAGERRPVPELLLALPRLATVIVAGWILVSGVWGVDLSAALTALGVTSLVVSFALQDTLSGLASGVLLLSDQPFQPGDWIQVEDIEGVVVDVNWRTTHIRNRDGDMVIVPNSQLAGSSLLNFSSPDPLHRVVVSLQVAYVNPPTLAKAMLLDAAMATPGVLEDPSPRVRVVQIDDPLMGYEVDMWVRDFAIAPRVKSDFGSLVWYQSHRHEVPLPSPAQDLYLYDGGTVATEGVPSLSDVRHGLQSSPLLSSLSDEELDQLARSARPARFAEGEVIVDSRSAQRDLVVLVSGLAKLVLVGAEDQGDVVVADFSDGETIGLLDRDAAQGRALAVRAVTDCEVLIIDSDVAGEVGSRNAELAAALNRTAAIRRRRLERIVESRSAPPSEEPEESTS